MSPAYDLVFLGSSSLDSKTGAPLWEPFLPIANDNDDIEPFGPTDVFQSLGVYSRPYQKDENGHAEAIILRHCGGKNAVCIAGRDLRATKIYGQLAPGDVAVCTTGKEQAAMLLLKDATRTAALLSKDSSGKNIGISVNGTKDKLQIFAFGGQIQFGRDGLLIAFGGASALFKDGKIVIGGTLMAGKGVGPNTYFMLGPVTGSPGAAASAPMVACLGMSAGAP